MAVGILRLPAAAGPEASISLAGASEAVTLGELDIPQTICLWNAEPSVKLFLFSGF